MFLASHGLGLVHIPRSTSIDVVACTKDRLNDRRRRLQLRFSHPRACQSRLILDAVVGECGKFHQDCSAFGKQQLTSSTESLLWSGVTHNQALEVADGEASSDLQLQIIKQATLDRDDLSKGTTIGLRVALF